MLEQKGYQFYPYDPRVARWAEAARLNALEAIQKHGQIPAQLRHQKTWYVGLDLLENDAQGAVNSVPFLGSWEQDIDERPLHRAQVSIIYPGYPKRDANESEANHRFRMKRFAAHVDGLLPIGENRRRFALECHAYILGISLNGVQAAPTVVWEGSHKIMQRALRTAHQDQDVGAVDVTEIYQQARREVFETCPLRRLSCKVGESFLLHRFSLHGTAPWGEVAEEKEGRMVAFFRPEIRNHNNWFE